jgi:hypothetical protein
MENTQTTYYDSDAVNYYLKQDYKFYKDKALKKPISKTYTHWLTLPRK